MPIERNRTDIIAPYSTLYNAKPDGWYSTLKSSSGSSSGSSTTSTSSTTHRLCLYSMSSAATAPRSSSSVDLISAVSSISVQYSSVDERTKVSTRTCLSASIES